MKMVNGLIAAAVAMVLAFGTAQAAVVSAKDGKLAEGLSQATYIYDDAYSVEACNALINKDLKRWEGVFSTITETRAAEAGRALIKGRVGGVGEVVSVDFRCKEHKRGIKVTWIYTGVILSP